MSGRRRLLCLLVGLHCAAAAAAPDLECLVEYYSRYIEEHNEAFLNAATELEQRSPAHYELLSDFIDYQIRSNTLKAYVVAYLGSKAPRQLQLNATLAKMAPDHSDGAVHRIMMADTTYRNSFSEWQRKTRRFLEKSSYSEDEWSAFVEARNILNRLLSQTSQYPALIRAHRTAVASVCQIR